MRWAQAKPLSLFKSRMVVAQALGIVIARLDPFCELTPDLNCVAKS